MLELQYLQKISDKVALPLTQEMFDSLLASPQVDNTVKKARELVKQGNIKEYRKVKGWLPAIQWCGIDASGKGQRIASALTSTGLYMVDIDHMTAEGLPPGSRLPCLLEERRQEGTEDHHRLRELVDG